MGDWKQSLDRYLTTEPEDNFTPWVEKVVEAFSEEFYEANEDWIEEPDGLCNNWLNQLFGEDPEVAARLIEKAFMVNSIL